MGMPVIPLTEQETDDALQSGNSLDELDQFTFSIPTAASIPDPSLFWETGDYKSDPLWTNRQPYDTYSVLDATQANNFRLAIAAWDELIEPDFAEVVDNTNLLGHGEVRVAFTADNMSAGTAGYAFQGSNQTPTSIVGDIWLNSTTTSATFAVGTDDYATFLHEIGHTLGLKHPFESPVINPAYDDTRFTIMSYTTPYAVVITPTGGGYSIAIGPVNPLTPSVLDIRAVQSTYGADTTTRTGNDTYTFNQVDTVYKSIYDAGGTDTIDLTGVTRDSIIDLRPGSTSSVGGPWTEAEQIAYYAAITGDTESNISAWFNDPDPAAVWYDWTNNLGIAFSTTIENLIAGSGDDTITGNSVGNVIRLNLGGNDTVDGGDGDDGFYFGGAFTGLDVVNGGAGTLDQVGLQGDYSAGVTLTATSFSNLEMLVLLAGNDTRFGDPGTNFYSYNLTTADANVAAGQLFAISFNTLRAGENVTVNGSAETNGAFLTYAGLGIENLTGGAGDDGFYFGEGRFGPSETVNGGAGTMDQLGLQGDHTIIFGAGQLAGIEMIVCLSAIDARFNGDSGALYNYNLTMNEGNVAVGGVLYISANQLIAGETLTFVGSAETDGGRFVVYGGAGADMIHGSLSNDTIYGNGGADGLVGNGGADTFAYTDVSHSTSAAPDFLSDFAAEDVIDLSAIDANTVAGGDQAFTFIGTAAFSNTPGELRVIIQPGPYVIQGDINGDGVADLTINIAPTNVPTGADFLL
jgi:hypothetical protein